MEFLQAYYTSCRMGQSNPGFQYYSYSKDITPAELAEIEKLTVYNKPLLTVENDNLPISTIYKKLESGKYLIASTKYIGKDYAGSRTEGNRFTHALVQVNSKVNGVGSLINNINFKRGLLEVEANIETTPELLENLNINEITKEDDLYELKLLSEIFNNNDKLSDQLALLFAALIEKTSTQRKIIIADNHKNINYLIRAINALLPHQLSNPIYFKTYTKDPSREDYDIIGTCTEGVNFDFGSDIAVNHQYYLVHQDMEKSSLIELNENFKNSVLTYFLYKPEQIVEFKNFIVDYLNYETLNHNFYSLVDLFVFKINPRPLVAQEYERLLNFVEQYAKDTKIDELLELFKPFQQFNQSFNVAIETQSPEDILEIANRIFGILFNCIEKINSDNLKNDVLDYWLDSWSDFFILHKKQNLPVLKNINEHWKTIQSYNHSISDLIEDKIFDIDTTKQLKLSIFYSAGFFNCAKLGEFNKIYTYGLVNQTIETIKTETGDFHRLLNNLNDQKYTLPNLSLMLYERLKNDELSQEKRDQLIKSLHKICAAKNSFEAVEHHFSKIKDKGILFHLLGEKFRQSNSDKKTFWDVYDVHFKNGQNQIQDFKTFFDSYLEHNNGFDEYELKQLINNIAKDIANENQKKRLVNDFEFLLTFEKPNDGDRNRINDLYEFKEKNINTDNDHHELLKDIYDLQKSANINIGAALNKINIKKLKNLNKQKLQTLHKWLLQVLVDKTKTKNDFDELFEYANEINSTIKIEDELFQKLHKILKQKGYQNEYFLAYLNHSFIQQTSKVKDDFYKFVLQKLTKLSPKKLTFLLKEIKPKLQDDVYGFAERLINKAKGISQDKPIEIIKRGFKNIFTKKNKDNG